jgi:hypothetical protein
MRTFLRTMAIVAVAAMGFSAKPAQAQVSVGIATPGFALGVGPGAGFVGVGGVYPGYPVYAPPVIAGGFYGPRPIVPAPIYGRPFYGPGYAYGRPVYGPPRYAAPVRRYR